MQWSAIVVTGMSMSMRWGDEIAVGKGPPGQWERHVVGSVLLLFVAALAMSLTARKSDRPGLFALSVSLLASLGTLALALGIRSTALENGQPYLLVGGGWMWMTAGGCIALGTVASAFALLARPKEEVAQSKKAKSKSKR